MKEEPHTPQEINYKGDCKEQSHNCELWEHLAVAAWRVSENDFDTVAKILAEKRDLQEPIIIKVYQKESEIYFDIEVIEYLERKVIT